MGVTTTEEQKVQMGTTGRRVNNSGSGINMLCSLEARKDMSNKTSNQSNLLVFGSLELI